MWSRVRYCLSPGLREHCAGVPAPWEMKLTGCSCLHKSIFHPTTEPRLEGRFQFTPHWPETSSSVEVPDHPAPHSFLRTAPVAQKVREAGTWSPTTGRLIRKDKKRSDEAGAGPGRAAVTWADGGPGTLDDCSEVTVREGQPPWERRLQPGCQQETKAWVSSPKCQTPDGCEKCKPSHTR